MGRSLNEACPSLRARVERLIVESEKAGLIYLPPGKIVGNGWMITSVGRQITEQMALFVQGRLPLDDVNRFRAAATMSSRISAADNAKAVTWTLDSAHIMNPLIPGKELASAIDIAIVKNGRATWEEKVSVNDDEIPDYDQLGAIWEALGGVYGGRWRKPDRPHLQEPGL